MSCNTCGNPMTSHFHTKGYCSEVCLRDGHIEALEAELAQKGKVIEVLASEIVGAINEELEWNVPRETVAETIEWAESQLKGKK